MLSRIAMLALLGVGIYWGYQAQLLPTSLQQSLDTIVNRPHALVTTEAELTEGDTQMINGVNVTFDKVVDDFRCIGSDCPESGGIATRITLHEPDSSPVTTVISSDQLPTQISDTRSIAIKTIEGGAVSTSSATSAQTPYRVVFAVEPVSSTSSSSTLPLQPLSMTLVDTLLSLAHRAGLSTEKVTQACSILIQGNE